MKVEINSKKNATADIVIYMIMAIVIAVILIPMIVLRENYYFTVHDYLDSWPSLFKVLRRGGIFFNPDGQMPILNGMSASYLYFDFGIYRILNFFFGFIWGEIINKALAIGIGIVAMYQLLDYIFPQNLSKNQKKILALAYAITPVYPLWSISFAVLPLLFRIFIFYYNNPQKSVSKKIILFLMFGFFVYFPCIGIFVVMLWGVGIIGNIIFSRKININLIISLFLMGISSIIFNINIVIYMLKGIGLNKSLLQKNVDRTFTESLKWLVLRMKAGGVSGQYHANPVVKTIIVPVCVIGGCILFILYFRHKYCEKKRMLLIWRNSIIGIAICSFIYSCDENGYIEIIIKKILPMLKGFNFGRILYFNNILWYIAFAAILRAFFSEGNKRIAAYIIVLLQVINILLQRGYYQNTADNTLYYSEVKQDSQRVTYKEFFDVDYFEKLKEEMKYKDEGVISIGYEPAVAMYNGFNTLDGYICTNPLDYHNEFRKIIAPALEESDELAKIYDGWGGRIYAYIDGYSVEPDKEKNIEEKELLINTEAFEELGGKYILSRCKISNAEELNLKLYLDMDSEDSIYHVFVYTIEK